MKGQQIDLIKNVDWRLSGSGLGDNKELAQDGLGAAPFGASRRNDDYSRNVLFIKTNSKIIGNLYFT